MRTALKRRTWDVLGILASIAVVLVAYWGVAFGGRTFDTSAEVPGVNGNLPPTVVAAFARTDGGRYITHVTKIPPRMCSVRESSDASIVHASKTSPSKSPPTGIRWS